MTRTRCPASRRAVGYLALVGLVLMPVVGGAQPKKVHRIGVLLPGSAAGSAGAMEALRQGLREYRYLEGQNVSIEWRFADGRADRLPDLARELVGLDVDVLVTPDGVAAGSLRVATQTIPIPIVLAGVGPRFSLISNLARPGGNMTGLSSMAPELEPKRMEFLKEVAPRLTRVASLRDVSLGIPRAADLMIERTGRWGLTFIAIPVRGPEDIDAAFATAVKERAGALSVANTPLFHAHRRRLAELALRHRLAWIAEDREYADAGSMMSYGAEPNDLIRRSASYVDRVLKGAKPGTLPIEQPTRFELVVNLRTAKILGLTIPDSVLGSADQVIR